MTTSAYFLYTTVHYTFGLIIYNSWAQPYRPSLYSVVCRARETIYLPSRLHKTNHVHACWFWGSCLWGGRECVELLLLRCWPGANSQRQRGGFQTVVKFTVVCTVYKFRSLFEPGQVSPATSHAPRCVSAGHEGEAIWGLGGLPCLCGPHVYTKSSPSWWRASNCKRYELLTIFNHNLVIFSILVHIT